MPPHPESLWRVTTPPLRASLTESADVDVAVIGGIVRWNDGDECWDCPLHGSRFAPDGTLLHGPAVRDLSPR